LDYHIRIGAELLETEVLLLNRIGVKNKRRKKLTLKAKNLRDKLEGTSLIDRVSDILKHGKASNQLDGLAKEEQDALLSRLEQARRRNMRKEKTEDRVVLTENWRIELSEKYPQSMQQVDQQYSQYPAFKYAQHVQSKHQIDQEQQLDTLRIVVLSDTHGFEQVLTQDGQQVPEGDVLLHLGDFGVDRVPKEVTARKADEFDRWLSQLPHQRKIIIRGNHDPKTWSFVHSNAEYVVQPTQISIGGFVFALIPYVSGGLSNRKLPHNFDILASHVPSKGILDKCLSGKYAGSHTLKRSVNLC
jgi:calcineurin-like phosphoesterase family protein